MLAEHLSQSRVPAVEPQNFEEFTDLSFRAKVDHLSGLRNEQERLWSLANSIEESAEELKIGRREDFYEAYRARRKESEEVRKHAWRLRDDKVGLMYPLLFQTARHDPDLNSYEKYILEEGGSRIRINPSFVIQDNALEVLEARADNRHLTEDGKIKAVIEKNLEKYKGETAEDPKRHPDHPLAALQYAIDNSVYQVYGQSEVLGVLERRIVTMYAETIRSYAEATIPEGNTINRQLISQLLEICAAGDHPEWRGGRFLQKIWKHVNEPYTDEEFTTSLKQRQDQAYRLTEEMFKQFPSVLACGVTGSLARENGFGFHPTSSDVDILVYTFENNDPELRSLTKFVRNYGEKEDISVCPATIFPDPLGMGFGQAWEFNNPETIRHFLSPARFRGPEDVLFETMAIMAANHVYGDARFIREKNKDWYKMTIDEPFKDFYQNQVLPLKKAQQELFSRLA